jgi:hypothetical protein
MRLSLSDMPLSPLQEDVKAAACLLECLEGLLRFRERAVGTFVLVLPMVQGLLIRKLVLVGI